MLDINLSDSTLGAMEDDQNGFDSFKDVVLLGVAGIKMKANDNFLRTELMEKQIVEQQTMAETCTRPKKRRENSRPARLYQPRD